MKILVMHVDYVEWEAKKKAFKGAEEGIKEGKHRVDDCLLVLTAVEKRDEKNPEAVVEKYIQEIKNIAQQVNAKRVVVYPYAHLSSDLANPKVAENMLKDAEEKLKDKFEVFRSPFGWYKAFTVACKGHPLSELSRSFGPEEGQDKNFIMENTNETYNQLIAFLNKNNAEYRLINHPPEGRTEIVSKMRNNELSQAAKCIIVIIKTGKNEKKYILAVVPGNTKVDLDALKSLFKGTYASFATPEVAEKLAGSVSGTILPFSFNPELELIVDPSLIENNDELYFNAARLDSSLALKTKDYKRLAKPRLESIAKPLEKEDDVSEALKAENTLKSYWFILDTNGKLNEVSYDKENKEFKGFNFDGNQGLRKFAAYELAKSRVAKEEPPHVKYMRKLELVDYEPGSDPGNLRFYPKGRLIKGLIERWVTQKVKEYGGMEMESPIMYDLEHPSLKSYLHRFPARQYTIQTPNKKVFLRFAACFGQMLEMHDAQVSYKQMPVWLYELTRYSFRVEQHGELTGLRRLRAFTMPDCHAFCADEAQAKSEMERRFQLCREVQEGIGFSLKNDLEFAIRVTKEFWEKNQDFVKKMVKMWGKPTLIEMWDKRFFYFSLKYEWNFVDALEKCSALSTDQIDVENGERYDINYIDQKGAKQHPLILHCSPSGAVERVMYALLEKASMAERSNQPPLLPLWLAPTQVRIIPVSANHHLVFSENLAKKFNDLNIRADVDDRVETVGKRIRDSEQEWVPYTLVVGDKEVNGSLIVRDRSKNQEISMEFDDLVGLIQQEVSGRPYDTLPLPRLLSKRISFVG